MPQPILRDKHDTRIHHIVSISMTYRSSHEGFVIYPEDKKLAQQLRFEEVKNQSKTSFTTKYGPSFKKSKHPLALMVR